MSVQVIKRFLKHSNVEVRSDAIMIMSSLVNETEANVIEDSGSSASPSNHLPPLSKCFVLFSFLETSIQVLLFTSQGATSFIVGLLRKAMASSKHKASDSQGSFSAVELLSGLNRIAVNDSNKNTVGHSLTTRRYEPKLGDCSESSCLQIVEEGALPVLTKALKSSNAEEQELAAKTVWTLSFGEKTKPKVDTDVDQYMHRFSFLSLCEIGIIYS